MGKRDKGREVPTPARVSAADIDEQRLSMVLELYYRRQGEREKVEREKEKEMKG
jgi:hypothetical protein